MVQSHKAELLNLREKPQLKLIFMVARVTIGECEHIVKNLGKIQAEHLDESKLTKEERQKD